MRNNFKPKVERLEARAMPATAWMSGTTLVVAGTAGDDVITVSQSGGAYSVSGVAGTFSGVNQVKVFAGAGNDLIDVQESVPVQAVIYGEGGNDTLFGGSGNDRIYGGDGDDVIHGRGGNDYMNGWHGTDTYFGGAGFDHLQDFIGEGSTTPDNDVEQITFYS